MTTTGDPTSERIVEAAPPEGRWGLFSEGWDPAYGTAADFDLDAPDDVTQAEPGDGPVSGEARKVPLAFVDGTRRVELSLWAENDTTGKRVPGVAGAYAVGARPSVVRYPLRHHEWLGVRADVLGVSRVG